MPHTWSAPNVPQLLRAREQQWGTRGASWRASSATAELGTSLCARMGLDRLLVGHRGCVNHLQWSDTGACVAGSCVRRGGGAALRAAAQQRPPRTPKTQTFRAPAGSLLCSGSDDLHICLWDVCSGRHTSSNSSSGSSMSPLLRYHTGHSANIFCVKFMPTTGQRLGIVRSMRCCGASRPLGPSHALAKSTRPHAPCTHAHHPGSAGDSSQPIIATCAGDEQVRVHDVHTAACVRVYAAHAGRVKKLVTEPGNPHLLISCSEDGTGAWARAAQACCAGVRSCERSSGTHTPTHSSPLPPTR
jgi:WD40 repeat protein